MREKGTEENFHKSENFPPSLFLIGRTISKLGMKAYLNLKDEFTNLKSDIEKKQALIKKGISIQEANKIVKEEKVKRKEENQDIVNQLDRETIQEYGNKNFIVSASNFASDMTMAILGANGMTNAGINPIVSNALAQGAKGFAEATASTTNKKDIAVDTISSGAWGAIFNGANNLLGKTGLGKVSTNKLANFGKFFLKNAISSAVASGTTQSLDIFKSNPNYDYIDWQQVEKGIQSGKYKNIEEFLDSNDYISMVTKNRASQIIMSSIITAFINTFVEYGKNPSIQQIHRQDDAYKTLGLSRNASDEEIRSTYRKLAKLYHPDNSTTGNTEMFTKINEAYHTIIDSRIMNQNIQTTQPSNASQNTDSSLMNLPQGDISYLYQKYNIPKINTDIQLQQDTQNVANNTSNVSNDLNLVQNTSNNVSSKITTPTNKKQNLIPNNSNIQGLEDYTEQDIKDIVSDYIQDLDTGVKIKDIALNGSRARGNSKATSDLDVVIEYDGDMTEDSLFNELNKEPLIIDGIKVDINPITASKSGTLEEYMRKSKLYDEQQNLPQEYEESEIFEPKEEYKTTTLKDEIERYTDLPKEEMSFYDLQYNGYYEDTSLAIENYIKETYDLKGKDLNVYVEDSRVSESKYIRIEDENDDVAEIRLSTHSNNETHPDYQKQVFYNKNDSIDEVERMIDEAVREVLKSTFKYNVDIMKENNYNISTGMQELYDDGRATRVGELVNEFKDKLTARQWKTYFKRIDNNGRKYNFGNNEKNVIHIGNKLVFSKYTNGKPQVYDIVKLEARLLKTYGMTAKQFADTFIRKLVKEGYNETEIREFIRNLGEEPLLERNDTSSNVIANRSERTSKNDRQVDRTSQNRNERNQFLQENGKLNSNDDVENSKQSSFSTSEIDSEGNTLSKEQQEYFKDSKVRDENDNLIPVYHGTQNGGFTEFHGYSYFTDSPDTARSYSGGIENITKYTFESGQRTTIGNYKGYLNLINPYIIDLKGAEWGEINIDSLNIPEIQQWINEVGVSTWNDNGKTFISTDDIVSIVDAMNDSGKNHDGIILKNIRDNGMRANINDNISTDYVAFKGKEQFKSIDNKTPTDNPDILKEPTEEYEYTTEKDKLHLERAEETFGYTNSFQKAVFLTYEGKLIDFSDGSNRRIEDHRAIMQVFDEDFESNTDYLIKFMNEGNIRISPEVPGIEISNFSEPSNAQLDMIEQYAEKNKYSGYFVVDFCNKYGDNIGSLEYEDYIDPAQIVEDVEEYFRTGELPIVNESSTEYNEQAKNEMPIKVLKSTNRISKPQVVGQRIWEGFEKQGYIDLNGKTVKNVQDVAELAQIFRNPKYETFRIIYTNGETIVGQEAITSYLPGSSKISVDENMSKAYYKIKDRMKRLDANGYYLVREKGTEENSHF